MLYSGCGPVDAQAQLVKMTVQFVCFGLSCLFFGMTVTRFAWIMHGLGSKADSNGRRVIALQDSRVDMKPHTGSTSAVK